MMTTIRNSAKCVLRTFPTELPLDVIWIDLLNPTIEEVSFVESRTHARIPSIDSLSEIESSSRLAVHHDILSLSIPAVAAGDTVDAYLTPTGFILMKSILVTVRFATLSTFDAVTEQVKQDETIRSAPSVFTALLEAMVDRGADVLERLGAELTIVSKSVFRGDPSQPKHIVRSNAALRRALTSVGTTGDRLALARDALLAVGRVPPFVLNVRKEWIIPEFGPRLDAVAKDILSLKRGSSVEQGPVFARCHPRVHQHSTK
jgi:magnesium transporter